MSRQNTSDFVAKTGCYHWVQGMTVLDAIHAAGGFTNFVSGPIFITHLDGTAVIWDCPPAAIDATNEPPVLSRNDDVYVRIF
jgi:protein involved in polysaccharide export with SLBB domain